VRFDYLYDVLGRKTSVAATIGATADYVNTYRYDNLGRTTRITQSGDGGNTLAEKRVDFFFDELGQAAGATRWADLDGNEFVARTDRAFDELGRMTQLGHTHGTDVLDNYQFSWNKLGQLTDLLQGIPPFANSAGYSYDATGQLTDVDNSVQDDESYDYDDNGNRETANGATYATGDHNRLMENGPYRYDYDGEGNRTLRYVDDDDDVFDSGDTDITVYQWDHRNRLVSVVDYLNYENYCTGIAAASQAVEYVYDPFNQLVGRTLTVAGTLDVIQAFVHDAGQIVLDFEAEEAGPLSLAHRYLWGANVDELLATETIDGTPGTLDDTAWALTDHQGTVRDVVAYDGVEDDFIVVAHMDYDAYGNLVGVPPSAAGMFLYTARLFDAATCLQNNLNRWYDATTGRWLSVDPIGFNGGDANRYGYVRNSPMNGTDPDGFVTLDLDPEKPDSMSWTKAELSGDIGGDTDLEVNYEYKIQKNNGSSGGSVPGGLKKCGHAYLIRGCGNDP
jgi:RHS repeat-associated protein